MRIVRNRDEHDAYSMKNFMIIIAFACESSTNIRMLSVSTSMKGQSLSFGLSLLQLERHNHMYMVCDLLGDKIWIRSSGR